MAAIDLLHIHRGIKALVGAVSLDHRRQQAKQRIGFLALFFGLSLVREINQQCAPQCQSTHTFGEGFGIHQHAAYIGVNEDRIGLRLRIDRAGQRTALTAINRISNAILISDLCLTEALNAHAKASCVHHNKHRGKAFVFLAHQPTGRAIVIQFAGRIAVNAHLVFDGTTNHAVAIAQRAIVVDHEFGDHEKRDALGAVRCARGLGQYQMNDVVRHVMFTGRDENLGSGNGIGSVAIGHSLGTDHPQIGAAVRLRQVHGAGPFVRDHLVQIFLLLLFRPLSHQCRNGTVCQPGIHAKCLI